MERKTTAERLKQIMDERKLKQVDILDACKPYCRKFNEKLGKSHLSQYVSGKVLPDQRKLTVLAAALNVSEAWLMGFDVARNYPPTDSGLVADSAENIFQLVKIYYGAEVWNAMELFKRLDSFDRETIIEMIKRMLENAKYSAKTVKKAM